MDIEKYISSGILEEYLLNTCSLQERQEVECMSHIYPAIKSALEQLELSIENYVETHAVQPPSDLKAGILKKIADTPQSRHKEEQVISMTGSNLKEKSTSKIPLRLSIAASILFLVGSISLWYHFSNVQTDLDDRLAQSEFKIKNLKSDNLLLSENLDSLSQNVQQKDLLLAELSGYQTKKIQLSGTEKSPSAKVNVFWNVETNGIYLKVDELPEPPENKQYQLWAIVEGEPTDMGVFDLATAAEFSPMPKAIENADAFAITLENKGGSEVPTLSDLYVIGNVL